MSKVSDWLEPKTELEKEISAFELTLLRFTNVFFEWQEKCQSVMNEKMGTQRFSILLAFSDKKPKTFQEVGAILYQEPDALRYHFRELEKKQYLKLDKESNEYTLSKLGLETISSYLNVRRDILLDLFVNDKKYRGILTNFPDIIDTLEKASHIYGHAIRRSTPYKSKILLERG